jgi:hypothetical protein
MHATSRSAGSVSYQQLLSPQVRLGVERLSTPPSTSSGATSGSPVAFSGIFGRSTQGGITHGAQTGQGQEAVRLRREHRTHQRSPTTAGSFTFTVQVKDETRATDTETFTIEILPPRGADDHHRGALQRNGRRVLLLRQPVRQRWCPALYLVRGRRDASSRPVQDWMPTQGPR